MASLPLYFSLQNSYCAIIFPALVLLFLNAAFNLFPSFTWSKDSYVIPSLLLCVFCSSSSLQIVLNASLTLFQCSSMSVSCKSYGSWYSIWFSMSVGILDFSVCLVGDFLETSVSYWFNHWFNFLNYTLITARRR